jgi:hypothetical protein
MVLNARKRRDRKRARTVRVWLDGIDVTKRCFYADGRRGVVRLYRERNGKLYIDESGVSLATEERRGHVRWGRIAR